MAELGYRVTVVGLDRFQKNLLKAEAILPPAVVTANQIVGDMIVNETMKRMNRQFKLPRSERTGALAMSVFTSAQPVLGSGMHGQLILIGGIGGDDIPYAGWWEYGYEKDVHPPPFRLFAPRGRTLYPAIRKLFPKIRATYEGVADLVANAIDRNEL